MRRKDPKIAQSSVAAGSHIFRDGRNKMVTYFLKRIPSQMLSENDLNFWYNEDYSFSTAFF